MRLLICISVLLICGCRTDSEQDRREQLLVKPIKIAETDGVTVWKVRDVTFGGSVYVYYTTPQGHLLDR